MSSNPPPEPRPRDRQTRRTRKALVAAADELFAEGRVPTVAEVAERADVARATAYRYFPTQEALLLETTFLGDSEAFRSLPELAREIEDPAERMAEAGRRSSERSPGPQPAYAGRSTPTASCTAPRDGADTPPSSSRACAASSRPPHTSASQLR